MTLRAIGILNQILGNLSCSLTNPFSWKAQNFAHMLLSSIELCCKPAYAHSVYLHTVILADIVDQYLTIYIGVSCSSLTPCDIDKKRIDSCTIYYSLLYL